MKRLVLHRINEDGVYPGPLPEALGVVSEIEITDTGSMSVKYGHGDTPQDVDLISPVHAAGIVESDSNESFLTFAWSAKTKKEEQDCIVSIVPGVRAKVRPISDGWVVTQG